MSVTRLVPPHMDKNWSFQMVSDQPLDRGEFILAMELPEVADANPFLQGFDSKWVMIEFWTRDEGLIRNAAGRLADHFNVKLLEGQFTRADLGLE